MSVVLRCVTMRVTELVELAIPAFERSNDPSMVLKYNYRRFMENGYSLVPAHSGYKDKYKY